MDRLKKMWGVNVVLFILGLFLSVTGLVNAWVLPHGYEAKGSFLIDIRHFLTECHEWAGLLFILTVGVHLMFHSTYVRNGLKKFGWFHWVKR